MAVLFESTNRSASDVSFKEALIRGQAPDMGLYTPKEIPVLSDDELESFRNSEYYEIAHLVAMKFLDGEIQSDEVKRIVKEAYDFDIPLDHVYDDIHVMRLDRGPTASFKDFAARMMARLMQYFLIEAGRDALILTATSGDTGSAVANAFHNLDNIRVVVLFPENEVTDMQRKQMTTLGGNVSTVAIDGKFDDCQAIVKKAVVDKDLNHLNLSSANSINFGRLLPQSIYYFYAHSRLAESIRDNIVFSVPCGNFGDLMGGILAREMGLPVEKFLVATNENNEFPRFLETGDYSPIAPSIACISNAMNVGHPSNLARLFHVYGGWIDEMGVVKEMPDLARMREDFWSISVSDNETRDAIKLAYERHDLLLEPHGAVGWKALVEYMSDNEVSLAVSLETADPAKFPEEINALLNLDPIMPDSLKYLEDLTEHMERISPDYDSLKDFLLKM